MRQVITAFGFGLIILGLGLVALVELRIHYNF